MNPSRLDFDAAGTALDAALALDAAHAEWLARVQVMALSSIPVFLLAVWPDLLPDVWRRAVLFPWAFCAGAVAWSSVHLWRRLRVWRRERRAG